MGMFSTQKTHPPHDTGSMCIEALSLRSPSRHHPCTLPMHAIQLDSRPAFLFTHPCALPMPPC
jgi:hypothetical protein